MFTVECQMQFTDCGDNIHIIPWHEMKCLSTDFCQYEDDGTPFHPKDYSYDKAMRIAVNRCIMYYKTVYPVIKCKFRLVEKCEHGIVKYITEFDVSPKMNIPE